MPTSSPASRLRRVALKLALPLVSAIAFLMLCEGVLRLCGYATGAAVYYDPEVGLRYYPNQSRRMLVEGVDVGTVTMNEWGFRGPPFDVAKRPGVRRIACLGDSFTLGWAVDDSVVYPRQLQEWFDARVGAGKMEVLNLGQPDFNTVNEARLYDTFVSSLQPDVVILGYVLNDMQPETLGPVNMNSRIEHMVGSTAIMRALRYHLFPQLGVYQYGQNSENTRRRNEYFAHSEEILDDPSSELARPYWDVSMTALKQLAGRTRQDGVKLLMVVFPNRFQLERLRKQLEEGASADEATRKITIPQSRLAREAAALELPFLDLWPAFQRVGIDAYGVLDVAHPSARGFRAAAGEIGNKLCELLECK